jgi:ribosomal protein S27AE
MGLVQKFVTRCLPKQLAAAIEDESRRWIMTCSKCGHETSVWEAGGVRYKAAGNPVRRHHCPRCGPAAHRLHLRPAETPPEASEARP